MRTENTLADLLGKGFFSGLGPSYRCVEAQIKTGPAATRIFPARDPTFSVISDVNANPIRAGDKIPRMAGCILFTVKPATPYEVK